MADKNGRTGWTDREILVCLLSVMEHSNCKLEYVDAPYPPGRNANGFRQKINVLKCELQGEFESIKAGNPVDTTPNKKKTPKSTPRKRKAKSDDETGQVETLKKRGRVKKQVTAEAESEVLVKDEPEGELSLEAEAETDI